MSGGERAAEDFEVIPTPGHTPGTTSYLWNNGTQPALIPRRWSRCWRPSTGWTDGVCVGYAITERGVPGVPPTRSSDGRAEGDRRTRSQGTAMITNERQYRIANAELKLFDEALAA